MLNEAESLERGGVVAGDLACMGCGYNLRTLAVEGVCTECGVPVGDSVAFERETGGVDVRRLERGAWFFALATLIDAAYFGSVPFIISATITHTLLVLSIVSTCKSVLQGVLCCIGILQFSQVTRAARMAKKWRIFCLIFTMMNPIMSIVWGVLQLAIPWMAGVSAADHPGIVSTVYAARFMEEICGFIFLFIGFYFMRQVMRQLRQGRLGTFTAIAFVMYFSFHIMRMAMMWFPILWLDPFKSIDIATWIFFAVIFVYLVTVAVVARRLRVRAMTQTIE